MKHKMRRRKVTTRENSIKKWIRGRVKDNLPEPTPEEIDLFTVAYNMGFNMRDKEIYRVKSTVHLLPNPFSINLSKDEIKDISENVLLKFKMEE